MASSHSSARIARRWEVGVWCDSHRHMLGPHVSALLQKVHIKHSHTCCMGSLKMFNTYVNASER